MNYNYLVKTNIKVSEFALGCWPFAGGSVWGTQDKSDSISTVHAALDNGINFFDTAELYAIPPKEKTYGKTEEIIGNWFKVRKNRKKIILASKIAGPGLKWIRGGGAQYSPKGIEEALNNSLKRLKTAFKTL